MKKLFIVLVLGAFVACNDSASTTDSTFDSTKEAIDSSAEVKIDAIDSSADAQKDKLDSLENKVDSAAKN